LIGVPLTALAVKPIPSNVVPMAAVYPRGSSGKAGVIVILLELTIHEYARGSKYG
jgi:hypothetical protein